MKKSTLIPFLVVAFISLTFFQSCKKDKEPEQEVPVPDQTATFELDNVASATAAGWTFKNRSDGQIPGSSYGFANDNTFPAYSGAGYIFASFEAGDGVISVWAISPKVILQNGDKISFYTRTYNEYGFPPVYPDRLQLRMSVADKDSVGDDASSVGLFKVSLVDVNPGLSATLPTGFPEAWTKFEGTVTGLSKPTAGRYAFRYFVEDGGSSGSNSLAIGLDKVQYTSINH
ncbi:MAG: choice-of-anchor J domain-containing protein [Bacteroidota bacterium]